MFRAIRRLLTGKRECIPCQGKGYILVIIGDRKIRKSCRSCGKTGSVKR